MVRLLPLRLAGCNHRRAVLQPVPGGDAQRLRAVGLCRWLPGSAVRRAGVRPIGRPRRPQVHLSHHHPDHGCVDLPGRPPAELRHDRVRGARGADCAAHGPGSRARRRVWRRGDLCRGARSPRQTRFLHELDSDHRDPGPPALPRRHHVHADLRERQLCRGDDGGGCQDLAVRRLGLAHSVPGLDLSAGHLGVDPAANAGEVRPSRR